MVLIHYYYIFTFQFKYLKFSVMQMRDFHSMLVLIIVSMIKMDLTKSFLYTRQ